MSEHNYLHTLQDHEQNYLAKCGGGGDNKSHIYITGECFDSLVKFVGWVRWLNVHIDTWIQTKPPVISI